MGMDTPWCSLKTARKVSNSCSITHQTSSYSNLQMPVMDGWRFRAEQQLLTNVRVATVPVVLLTGTDNAEKSAKALHAAGFIEKPFEPDLLLGAVLKALKTGQRAALDRRTRS